MASDDTGETEEGRSQTALCLATRSLNQAKSTGRRWRFSTGIECFMETSVCIRDSLKGGGPEAWGPLGWLVQQSGERQRRVGPEWQVWTVREEVRFNR